MAHWNAGLWDVLRIYGDDTFTSPDFYAETLEKIVKRMKEIFPKAKLVDCICEQIGIDRNSLAEKETELFEIPERILDN